MMLLMPQGISCHTPALSYRRSPWKCALAVVRPGMSVFDYFVSAKN
jgi:hypothetical protein